MPIALRTTDEYEKHTDIQRLIEKVILRYDNDRLGDAIYALEPLVKKYPDNDLMLYALGEMYGKEGRYGDASKLYFALAMKQWDPQKDVLKMKYLAEAAKWYERYLADKRSVTEVEQKVGDILFFIAGYKTETIQ